MFTVYPGMLEPENYSFCKMVHAAMADTTKFFFISLSSASYEKGASEKLNQEPQLSHENGTETN